MAPILALASIMESSWALRSSSRLDRTLASGLSPYCQTLEECEVEIESASHGGAAYIYALSLTSRQWVMRLIAQARGIQQFRIATMGECPS